MKPVFEKKLWREGFERIAGVDEVGRGSLAGPIIAAAAIYPPDLTITGLNDSKKLSPKKREKIFVLLKSKKILVGIGTVSSKEIDAIKIEKANRLAMRRAVEKLPISPDYLLIDGNRIKIDLPIAQAGIVKGDGKCPSIAAASIIAKVIRDKLMVKLSSKYNLYNFNKHKGYGTREHLTLLAKHGPCPIHRRSFCPLRENQA